MNDHEYVGEHAHEHIADDSPEEIEALTAEQEALNQVIAKAQIEYLSKRVAELARENVRLRKEIGIA